MKPSTGFALGIGAVIVAVVLLGFRGHQQPDAQPGPAPGPQPKRLQLFYVRMKSCAACDKMERHTLNHPAVIKAIAERFTFEKVARDDARFKMTAFPGYVVLTEDGSEVQRGTGFRNADEFVTWLNHAKEAP